MLNLMCLDLSLSLSLVWSSDFIERVCCAATTDNQIPNRFMAPGRISFALTLDSLRAGDRMLLKQILLHCTVINEVII